VAAPRQQGRNDQTHRNILLGLLVRILLLYNEKTVIPRLSLSVRPAWTKHEGNRHATPPQHACRLGALSTQSMVRSPWHQTTNPLDLPSACCWPAPAGQHLCACTYANCCGPSATPSSLTMSPASHPGSPLCSTAPLLQYNHLPYAAGGCIHGQRQLSLPQCHTISIYCCHANVLSIVLLQNISRMLLLASPALCVQEEPDLTGSLQPSCLTLLHNFPRNFSATD
jgi:hypothetical protein